MSAKLNGLLLFTLGAIASAGPLFSDVWGLPVVGAAIFLSGIVELADAWYSNNRRTHYSSGIFSVLAGALISFQSAFALSGLMVILAVVLLADGASSAYRGVSKVSVWDVINGLANIGLGLLAWWLRDSIGVLGFGVFLGLRMAASGWQTLSTPSSDRGDDLHRRDDEHPNRALGLPPNPIVGFIHREAIAAATSRTPINFVPSA